MTMRRTILSNKVQQISYDEAISRVWGETEVEVNYEEGFWDTVAAGAKAAVAGAKNLSRLNQAKSGGFFKDISTLFKSMRGAYSAAINTALQQKTVKDQKQFIKNTLSTLMGGKDYASADPRTKKMVDQWYEAPQYSKGIKQAEAQYAKYLQITDANEAKKQQAELFKTLNLLAEQIQSTDPAKLSQMAQEAAAAATGQNQQQNQSTQSTQTQEMPRGTKLNAYVDPSIKQDPQAMKELAQSAQATKQLTGNSTVWANKVGDFARKTGAGQQIRARVIQLLKSKGISNPEAIVDRAVIAVQVPGAK